MRAFSGAILGRDHDVALPTVARIDGESLTLFSSTGPLGEWPLDRVRIIVLGDGYFDVVAEDRRLSLVVDEPDAFEEALAPKPARKVRVSQTGPVTAGGPIGVAREEPGRLSRLLLKRPRHGLGSVRPLPLGIVVAAVLTVGYFLGMALGDLVDLVTTESAESPGTPRADIVVRTFQGTGNETSDPFAVVAPWEVTWSVDGTDGALLEVTLRDEDGERTDLEVEDGPGQGAAMVHTSGVFVVEIGSTAGAEWSIQVIEIANPDTPDES